MLSEISEGRRVKPPWGIYWPGDLLPYTLRGISRKYALLLGQCRGSCVHLHWGPWVKGPGINFIKRKASSNGVKTYCSKEGFKRNSELFAVKEYSLKRQK
jgi:hypothetical protein